MKIIDQWIVRYYNQWQILVKTDSFKFFLTNTGAFVQRDMNWIEIGSSEAEELIYPKQMVG